ncbi:MAG: hypothetical protein Q9169_008410, partial [Polycauliona sp. 2 TL-2023]
ENNRAQAEAAALKRNTDANKAGSVPPAVRLQQLNPGGGGNAGGQVGGGGQNAGQNAGRGGCCNAM